MYSYWGCGKFIMLHTHRQNKTINKNNVHAAYAVHYSLVPRPSTTANVVVVIEGLGTRPHYTVLSINVLYGKSDVLITIYTGTCTT